MFRNLVKYLKQIKTHVSKIKHSPLPSNCHPSQSRPPTLTPRRALNHIPSTTTRSCDPRRKNSPSQSAKLNPSLSESAQESCTLALSRMLTGSGTVFAESGEGLRLSPTLLPPPPSRGGRVLMKPKQYAATLSIWVNRKSG